MVYFDILLIYRNDSRTKNVDAFSQVSHQFSHGPNYHVSVDTLTPSEEPLSNTLILDPSRNLLVFDYYQVTARFYGPSSHLYNLARGNHSK